MPKTNPIPSDPAEKTSTGRAASKQLKADQAKFKSGPKVTKSNGNSTVGGRSVGGTRTRGGAF